VTDELYTLLSGYQREKATIASLNLKIEELETSLLPDAIRYDIDRIQTSPKDTLSETMCEIMELIREKEEAINRAEEALRVVTKTIELVSDEKIQSMLINRWIGCEGWVETSKKMRWSLRWCYKLNKKAMSELEKKIRGKA